MSKDLVPIQTKLIESISDFNTPFTNYLTSLGLPIDSVLYPVEDRKKIINSLGNALEELPIQERKKSVYLTRFTASIVAGLFDGAVAYLWNETIKSIRKMVINFDLEYFFKVAENINNRYKNLETEDDLVYIGEYDLLLTCNRMGLITDHVFEVFKFINYMRNHSSSAHPNENAIRAFDILSWLDNCITYAINARPNHSSVKLKQLLYSIRNEKLPDGDLKIIGKNVQNLPQQMVDDLLWTIFGMYTDTKIDKSTSNNIIKISKFVWDASTESKKYEIGEKYGYFRKNGQVQRKERSDEFLKYVDGDRYKDEDSIAYEIREILNSLKSTHYSSNNFYNENAWAKALKNMIPKTGIIPSSVIEDWVKIIVICYSGNGLGYREGVDEDAAVYYMEYINNFSEKEVIVLLKLMSDREVLGDLDLEKPNRRFRNMCNELKNKTHNLMINKCLQFIISFPGKLGNVHKSSDYKKLISQVI